MIAVVIAVAVAVAATATVVVVAYPFHTFMKIHQQFFLLILHKDKQTWDCIRQGSGLALVGSGQTKTAINTGNFKAQIASNCIYFTKKKLW